MSSLDPNKTTFDNKPRVLAPAGSHLARNYAIIDIGTHMESYLGQPPTEKHKVILLWEFPQILHTFDQAKGPEPLSANQEYNFIGGDKSNLLNALRTWGRSPTLSKVDLKPYLGQYCTLGIIHKPKKSDPSVIHQRVADGGRAVSPIMDVFLPLKWHPEKNPTGTIKPFNPNVYFDLDEFTWDAYNKLPKWIREKIAKSKEWPAVSAKAGAPPQQVQPAQQQVAYAAPQTGVPQAAAPIMADPNVAPSF